MQKKLHSWTNLLCFFACFASLISCSRIPLDGTDRIIPSDGWVFMVNSEGPHWLGSEWWDRRGVDLSALSYKSVQLQKEGIDIPYLWVGEGQEKGLLFLAEVVETRFGSWGSYTLQLEKQGLQIERIASSDDSGQDCQDTSLERVELEQDNSYRSTAPLTTPWFWTSLRPPDVITFSIPLTRSIAGPITVTTQMWGQSSMPQNPDHHIRLVWDANPPDNHFWDGNIIERWDSIFTNFSSTANLSIAAPGETEAPVEVTWLDSIQITWRKTLELTGGSWERWFPEGFPQACWKGKMDDKLVSLLLTTEGKVYQSDPANTRITQMDAEVGWIGVPHFAPGPTFTRPRSLLNQQDLYDVEYLVLAPQPFHNELIPLMEKHRNEGLSVFLVSPEQVYDTFGHGIPDGSVINTMVNTLVSQGELQYFLLAGDTSVRIETSPEEMLLRIPTGWVRTDIVGETPSDFALVSDADGSPMTTVGRLPASNEAEMQIMVNKTLDWKPNRRMLFVSDDEAEFDTFIDKLAVVSSGDERLSASDPDARQKLLSWLRDAAGIMIYSGHGSLPMLGDEKLLTQEDAGNWDSPTVVIAWSCLCASFTHPTYQGLGESWLKSEKGTVAFVGPTGETTSAQQGMMAVAVQQSLVAGNRIGDALLNGWEAANSNDAKVSFLLLGDPALHPYSTESE